MRRHAGGGGGLAPIERLVKHIANHTSGLRRVAAALRRHDGGGERWANDVTVRDVNYCRYGGRRTDVSKQASNFIRQNNEKNTNILLNHEYYTFGSRCDY